MISKIKIKLAKSKFGKILLAIYHYTMGITRVRIKTFVYNLKDYSRYKELSFYTDKETFSLLINERKSLSRFGDGEMSWICQKARGYFGQENSKSLSDRLTEVLTSKDMNVLIGIPNYYVWGILTENILKRGLHSFWNLKMTGFD